MSKKEPLKETCIRSEKIYEGRVISLYVDQIELPDGNRATREYTHHIGAVGVLPLTAEGDVICVRQYRYAHRMEMLEIPAGKLDSVDEEPLSAALRELREETGATGAKMTDLGIYRSTPAILDERIYLYLAEDFTVGEQSLDDEEFLELERIPLSTLVDMVMRGEIPDGKTQVAVLKVWELLRRREQQTKEKQGD